MELKICPYGQNKGFGPKSGKQRGREKETHWGRERKVDRKNRTEMKLDMERKRKKRTTWRRKGSRK